MKAHLKQRQDWIRGRREKRKLARKARFHRQILRWALLATLLSCGIGVFTVLSWSIEDDDSIEVHGNQVTSKTQICSRLHNCKHKPIYQLDPKVLSKQICSLAAVKYAFVRRCLLPRPHLIVEILEEFPWATFTTDPQGLPERVIAQTGKFIPLSQFPDVIQPSLIVCGSPLLELTAHDIAKWASWITYIEAQTGETVEFIDMRENKNIKVKAGDLNLHLGSADFMLTKRLSRLSSLMQAIGPMRQKIQYINLGLDSNVPLKIVEEPKPRTGKAPAKILLQARAHNLPSTASVINKQTQVLYQP